MILIAAAAFAAAQPPSTTPTSPTVQHDQHMPAGHKEMDCCKDCCKDMAGKHEGHSDQMPGAHQAGHAAH